MPIIELTKQVDAPIEDVWKAWDDFGNIANFHPGLESSHLLGGSETTGLGAERQCNLKDGKNYIQERIVDYVPNKRLSIDIYSGTMPLKSAQATVELKGLGVNRTEVRMKMDYRMKFGVLGRLMGQLMKPQFRKLLQSALDSNKAFVENGVTIMRAA